MSALDHFVDATDMIRDPAWEAACMRYLWLVFNRAPDHHIIDAADAVLKYVVLPGYVPRVLH